jgi:radical SAM superfamily enzyme YgiQ (UPF0313 family)
MRPEGETLERATPPLALVALGRPLRDAGFDVRLIDAMWDREFRNEIVELAKDAVCLGISCLTGYSIGQGLEIAELAKRTNPSLPVIWGGWHPTFAAAQAARDPRVDVVVRGQGETTLVEVLDALQEHRSLRGVPGVTFRENNELVHSPDRPPQDINDLPPFDWDLVDVRRYIRVGPGPVRHANTIFSRGCPYYCDFCLDSRRKWNGLSLSRVREELEFWVLRNSVNNLRFYDGNFFLGRQRTVEFAEMILASDLAGRFTWSATGVGKRMTQFDGATLELLYASGCRQVAIGAESGSPDLLATITNKTTVEYTTEAVRLLTRHNINQFLFFMVGFPEEPEDALQDTLSLVSRLKAINPRLQLAMNFCIPLPGSQMFRLAVQKGLFSEPKQFADWAKFDFMRPNLPQVTDEYAEKVRRFMEYLQLAYPSQGTRLARLLGRKLWQLIYSPVRQAVTWRLNKQTFDFPIELKLHKLYARIAA